MTDRLPPNLLKLFTPRPPLNAAEPLDVDYGDRRCRRIAGIGSFMKEFQRGFDKDYVPTDTDEQKRLYRLEKRKKDAEEAKTRQEQEWNPNKADTNKSKDPFCTLFVAKIPNGTTDEEILAAFSVYGQLKGVKRVINPKNGKLRPYCFVEFEQEKDLEAVLERNDPVLIKNSRVILDVERGRTVRDWKPKRLSGGISSAPKKKPPTFATTSASQYPSYSSSSNGQRRGYTYNAPPPQRRQEYDSGSQQNSRKRGYMSPPRSAGSSAPHDYKRGRY